MGFTHTRAMPEPFEQSFVVPESGEMPDAWYRWLDRFLRERIKQYAGREFVLRLTALRRTGQQNRYLHAVFGTIARGLVEAGVTTLELVPPSGEVVSVPCTPDLVKAWYKALYGYRDDEGTLRSTASYDTTEMHDFIEAIRNDDLLIRSGIYIETPDEYRARQRAA